MTHQQAGRIRHPYGSKRQVDYRGYRIEYNGDTGYWIMPLSMDIRFADTLDACLDGIDRYMDYMEDTRRYRNAERRYTARHIRLATCTTCGSILHPSQCADDDPICPDCLEAWCDTRI